MMATRGSMSEVDLCAAFRSAAESDGWVVYPETSGWDLVLVWPGEQPVPPGALEIPPDTQVGVEAKLRPNADVLAQVIERCGRYKRSRPDLAAVLVPKAAEPFHTVAGALGVGVYTLRHCGPWRPARGGYERGRKTITAPIPRRSRDPVVKGETGQRLWLPPVVPQTPAGTPAPSPLTPWRIQAIRLCAILRERGYVTSQDFTALGINPQIWRDRWLRAEGRVHVEGRAAPLSRYVAIPGIDLPDVGFEVEASALLALDWT